MKKNIIAIFLLFITYVSQGQLIPLKTYFSPGATDNGCSTRESELGIWINEGRLFQRIEGLIFKTQQPGTIPFRRFWNGNRNDNGMTAKDFNSYLSQGYQDVGIEGYIFSSQQTGTIPLKSYYNQRDDDNHTSVLDADRDPAFKFVRIEGYIYPADYTTSPALPGGTYVIGSAAMASYISIPDNAGDGTNAQLSELNYQTNFKWNFEYHPEDGGWYAIRNQKNPAYALCLQNNTVDNYPLKVFTYNGGIDFQWKIVKTGNQFFIVSKWNGKYFDAWDRVNIGLTNGVPNQVQQWAIAAADFLPSMQAKYIQFSAALGKPTTNPKPITRGGWVQGFERGNIYYLNPLYGAHAVLNGKVTDFYSSKGWQDGYFGYPTGEATTSGNTITQNFEFDAMNRSIICPPNSFCDIIIANDKYYNTPNHYFPEDPFIITAVGRSVAGTPNAIKLATNFTGTGNIMFADLNAAAAEQQWLIKKPANENAAPFFYFTNKQNGKVLAGGEYGSDFICFLPYLGETYYQWLFTETIKGSGQYYITSKATGLALSYSFAKDDLKLYMRPINSTGWGQLSQIFKITNTVDHSHDPYSNPR